MVTMTLAQTLILIGVLLAVAGLLFIVVPQVPFLVRLPGDLVYHSNNVHIYAPLGTCLLLSLVITVLLNMIFSRH